VSAECAPGGGGERGPLGAPGGAVL
jgi:hypothetical protein